MSWDRECEQIRIKVILLGRTASSLILDNMTSDASFYKIRPEKEINRDELNGYCNDADIVLLVADLNDNFAVKNICTIMEMLYQNEILYTSIIANKKALPECKGISVSNMIIIEEQKDPTIQTLPTILEKMNRIIFSLCQVIENEISTYRVLDDDFSALITLQSFFEKQGVFQLYIDYDYLNFEKVLEKNPILRSDIEEVSKMWITFNSDENSLKKIEIFMDMIEMIVNEDAYVHFDIGKKVKKNKIIILLKYDDC